MYLQKTNHQKIHYQTRQCEMTGHCVSDINTLQHTLQHILQHVLQHVLQHARCLATAACPTRTGHVTYMNESCHIYEWVMSHIWESFVTYVNESFHMYEWVMSHIWMSHESCRIYEWVNGSFHMNAMLCNSARGQRARRQVTDMQLREEAQKCPTYSKKSPTLTQKSPITHTFNPLSSQYACQWQDTDMQAREEGGREREREREIERQKYREIDREGGFRRERERALVSSLRWIVSVRIFTQKSLRRH